MSDDDTPAIDNVEKLGKDFAKQLQSMQVAATGLEVASRKLEEFKNRYLNQEYTYEVSIPGFPDAKYTFNEGTREVEKLEQMVLRLLTDRVVEAHKYAESMLVKSMGHVVSIDIPEQPAPDKLPGLTPTAGRR